MLFKFRDHCRYQHYSEICPKSICKDKQCRFRHPRTCKHGDDCRFYEQNFCLFSHKLNKDVKNKETVKLEIEVEELKMEILNLKNAVNDKRMELDKLEKLNEKQIKRLEELEKETLDLMQNGREKDQQIKELNEEIGEKSKEIIKMMDENNELTLEVKNLKGVKADLLKEIELKDSLLEEASSDFSCTKCDFRSKKKFDLSLHMSTIHAKK